MNKKLKKLTERVNESKIGCINGLDLDCELLMLKSDIEAEEKRLAKIVEGFTKKANQTYDDIMIIADHHWVSYLHQEVITLIESVY